MPRDLCALDVNIFHIKSTVIHKIRAKSITSKRHSDSDTTQKRPFLLESLRNTMGRKDLTLRRHAKVKERGSASLRFPSLFCPITLYAGETSPAAGTGIVSSSGSARY